MQIRTIDAALMPPDAQPLPSCTEEYLNCELAKLPCESKATLIRAVQYATALHGVLSLRDMQMVCAVAAIVRLGGN